jgi:predicted MarR family transcription regulator
MITVKYDNSKSAKTRYIYFVAPDGETVTQNYTYIQAQLIVKNYRMMGIEFDNESGMGF